MQNRMERLIASGILYLLGVSVVLILKPSLMFSEDGTWKEFGIGRNMNTHTWMPFWLFAILWALISQILVTLVLCLRQGEPKRNNKPVVSQTQIDEVIEVEPEDLFPVRARAKRSRGVPMEMPEGYQILNREATDAAGGVPKQIYLGKGLAEN